MTGRTTSKRIRENCRGATSIEYALIAALLAVSVGKSIHCIAKYCIAPAFEQVSEQMTAE